MAYIGNPPFDVRSFGSTKFEFTATAGQTAFTGSDDNSKTLAFTDGHIEVYVNGVLMDNDDFSTSGGNTVTLTSAAAADDIITVTAIKTNVPNTDYVPASGGTFTGNVTVTGTVTADELVVDTNTLSVDATNNRVGIGTTSPSSPLHVINTAEISGSVPILYFFDDEQTDDGIRIVHNAGNFTIQQTNDAKNSFANRLRIDSDTGGISFYEDTGTTAKLFWDASAERLGIGVGTSPDAVMHVGEASYPQIRTVYNGIDSWDMGVTSGSIFKLGKANAADSASLFQTDDGNVGIATSSPSTKLHIGGAPDNKVITIDQSGRASAIGTYFSSGASDSRIDFYISDGNTDGSSNNRMSIKGNGRVGINTSSPASMLHVKHVNIGSGASNYASAIIESTDAQLDLSSTDDGTWGSAINFREVNTSGTFVNNWSIARTTTSGGNKLTFNYGTLDQHNNATKVTFDDNGDVSIGSIETTLVTPLRVKSNSSAHAMTVEEASGAETWQIGVDSSGDLNFYNSGSTTPFVEFSDSEVVRIAGSTAGTKLGVKGGGWFHGANYHQITLASNDNASWAGIRFADQISGGGGATIGAQRGYLRWTHGDSNIQGVTGRSGNAGHVIGSTEAINQLGFQHTMSDSSNGTNSGELYWSNSTNLTLYAGSDARLKENVVAIPEGEGKTKVLAMNPVSYNLISDTEEVKTNHLGFIAQELKDVVPEAVKGSPEDDEMMGVNYAGLTPILTAALKDALAEIENLKTRIEALENS